MEKRHFTYLTLGILVWAILGTIVAAYYFNQYDTYRNEYNNLLNQYTISFKANILLSYGNETKVWYNNTVLPLGSTAFTALNLTAEDIEYTDYADWGIFVTSINGVANSGSYGWLYCYWDYEKSEWMFPNYSSGKHILHEGDTVAFAYDTYPAKPPT